MSDDIDPRLVEVAEAVFAMARTGDHARLAAYLDAGTPADLTNGSGDTLIMLAAYHGHPETVKVLIEHGAGVDKTNDRGQSPLAGAVFKGEAAVVRLLLDAGADPRVGTPSAAATAEMFGQQQFLEWFAAGR